MAEQQARTRMTKERLAGVEQEEAELHAKVKRLEMSVDSSAPGRVKELQVTRLNEKEEAAALLTNISLLLFSLFLEPS